MGAMWIESREHRQIHAADLDAEVPLVSGYDSEEPFCVLVIFVFVSFWYRIDFYTATRTPYPLPSALASRPESKSNP